MRPAHRPGPVPSTSAAAPCPVARIAPWRAWARARVGAFFRPHAAAPPRRDGPPHLAAASDEKTTTPRPDSRDPLRPVRVGKRGVKKDLRLRPALVAALLPGLGHGDAVTLVSTGGRAPNTPECYHVKLSRFRRVWPDGGETADFSFVAGWAKFREAHALEPDDAIQFEAAVGGQSDAAALFPGGAPRLALSARVVRGTPRIPAELRPWPRSGRVTVNPSAVEGSSMCLFVPADAFEALFPDCGEDMLVEARVDDDGGSGKGRRRRVGPSSSPVVAAQSWRVKVVRGGGAKARSREFKHGRLSAGWPALAREGFRGALQAGQTLELVREGDRFGGPGPREVRMRVVKPE